MTLAVCLEGTLSDPSHRSDLRNDSFENYQAAVNKDEPNIKLIEFLKNWSSDIYVYSTTPDNLRPAILQWLVQQDLEVEGLILKKKNDYRPDHEVKMDMIKTLDNCCSFVIENSVKVAESLRAEGYLVLQV